MDPEDYNAGWNKPVASAKNSMLFHSFEIHDILKSTETQSKMMVDMGWGGEKGELLVNNHEEAVSQDENVLGSDSQQCK